MNLARILFLHGLDARPGGVKPTWLASLGHEVLNPALPREDFDESVRIAQGEFDAHLPEVVVGSSRGGAVALAMNAGQTPLVVLAPAWKFFPIQFDRDRSHRPTRLRILHSPKDALIPFGHSVELATMWPDIDASLIEVGADHSMNDEESLRELERTVRSMIEGG